MMQTVKLMSTIMFMSASTHRGGVLSVEWAAMLAKHVSRKDPASAHEGRWIGKAFSVASMMAE